MAVKDISKDTSLEDIPTPESLQPLFQPIKVGKHELKIRSVYAPLTRCRAIGTVTIPEAAQYYSERAADGQLIITEATGVSECSYGYPNTPGVHSEDQIEAWKPVIKAVHDKGAVFYCQLWHCGRASLPAYHDGELPVAPSEVAAEGQANDPKTFEFVDYGVPRALEIDEIPKYVEFFRTAARKAVDAGFDGVEIHATNGYLIAQFLQDSANKRTDAYGGSIENRCKFCLEIVKAITEEIGAERTGIRLGPYADFIGCTDSDPIPLFTHLVKELNAYNLAYMHFVEPRVRGNEDLGPVDKIESIDSFLAECKTVKITAGGYIDHDQKTRSAGADDIKRGHTDMVAYGRWALANPDFLKRLKLEAPLNKYDRSTFYMPGTKGYTDYPYLEDTEHASKYYTA